MNTHLNTPVFIQVQTLLHVPRLEMPSLHTSVIPSCILFCTYSIDSLVTHPTLKHPKPSTHSQPSPTSTPFQRAHKYAQTAFLLNIYSYRYLHTHHVRARIASFFTPSPTSLPDYRLQESKNHPHCMCSYSTSHSITTNSAKVYGMSKQIDNPLTPTHRDPPT